jgi:hypothetical protein
MKLRFTLSLTSLIVGVSLIATVSAQALVANISHANAAGLCKKHGGLTQSSNGSTEGCDYKRGNKDYVVACVPPGAGTCTVVSVIKPKGGSTLGDKRPPPGTVKPISGNKGNVGNGKPVLHPVKVGVENPPSTVKTDPIVTWKHGGMNQGNGRQR